MDYSVDVYYNANETVLEAVKKHVEDKYNVETTTCQGFLFLKSENEELFDTVLADLESEEHPYFDYASYTVAAESVHDFVNEEISEEELCERLEECMTGEPEPEEIGAEETMAIFEKIKAEDQRKATLGSDYVQEFDSTSAFVCLLERSPSFKKLLLENKIMTQEQADRLCP